jgi:hypothetical protein
MHKLYSFSEAIDHVTSGGRAYLVTQGPLTFIKGTSDGVKLGEVGSSELIDCPLKYPIWSAKYVIFAGVKPVAIYSYKDYVCVMGCTDIVTKYSVFDPSGQKVYSGDELFEIFNLQEWVDAQGEL